MSPIQQMLLGVGAVATKTYVDDVFSTYVRTYTGATATITNGIDLANKGGLVWAKNRTQNYNHLLIDTVRGGNKLVKSNSDSAEETASDLITAFNSNGYTVGADASFGSLNNSTTDKGVHWTFRKAPGFFDVVQITGDGTGAKAISHNLESIPGLILVKTTGVTGNWSVYHRSVGFSNGLLLNDSYGAQFASPVSAVSDTTFTITNAINENGRTYICYLFAGGESTAATARSVDFDGSGDYLSLASDAAFQFGTGDFTVEFWWKANSTSQSNYHQTIGTQSVGGTDTGLWRIGTRTNANKVYFSSGTGGGFDEPAWDANVNDMQWHHIAITRASGYIYCYVDGIKLVNSGGTNNITRSLTTSNSLFIGYNTRDGNYINGDLSNVRIVKGTAVYTSSFRPPTEPLTSITNTTLLCCNNSSTTGKTTGGTITANGDPTASSDSPFDDPAGFKFGDAEDQNVIKCGKYSGNETTSNHIFLGWEPQWVMIKRATGTAGWYMFDNMRGVITGGDDGRLEANDAAAENDGTSVIDFTSTGFELTTTSSYYNKGSDNSEYIYIAIRRPDGYVGKPPELGTSVFAMDTGNTQTTIPNYDSGFPVGFALLKNPGTATSWDVTARLTGTKYLKTDSTTAEANYNDYTFDSNTGWAKDNGPGTMQSWMWKRHAGFDVVTYTGDLVAGRQIPHSLNKIPEMLWVKRRNDTSDWVVWHKGLNSGTNSGQYYVRLNSTNAESSANYYWNNTTQNSKTYFTLGGNASVNGENDTFIAMLFASVDGISKVGSYTGNGSTSGPTITTGFSPRFLFIKRTDGTASWFTHDTLRGFSGNGNPTPYLRLDLNNAQTSITAGYPISTGFTLTTTGSSYNANGGKYIYYAHA